MSSFSRAASQVAPSASGLAGAGAGLGRRPGLGHRVLVKGSHAQISNSSSLTGIFATPLASELMQQLTAEDPAAARRQLPQWPISAPSAGSLNQRRAKSSYGRPKTRDEAICGVDAAMLLREDPRAGRNHGQANFAGITDIRRENTTLAGGADGAGPLS